MNNVFLKRFSELLDEKFNNNKSRLAKETGISPSTLSQYFPPRSSEPTAKQIVLLSQAFDCSMEYLMGISDDYSSTTPTIRFLPNLSKEELHVIKLYNKLGVYEREAILIQLEALADRQPATKR